MSKSAVQRLAHLLEVERTALLAGDFETISALVPDKEALASNFDGANAGELRALSASLARNEELLVAAKDGVSTVLSTLRQQKEARQTLSSYDSNGKATTITQKPSETERRF